MITISEFSNPELFKSKHWIHNATADGLEYFSMTGIILTNNKGTGGTWLRDTYALNIKLPTFMPNDRQLQVIHWAPFVTLNAIFNQAHAINAGWAVDEFWGPGPAKLKGSVTIHTALAISDIDGYLYRIGYRIDLVGKLIKYERPIID